MAGRPTRFTPEVRKMVRNALFEAIGQLDCNCPHVASLGYKSRLPQSSNHCDGSCSRGICIMAYERLTGRTYGKRKG